jgi:hypothetical protein
MDATETVDLPDGAEAAGDDQPVAWYEPGLYRRVQERRRPRVERAPRVSIWQRIRGRGLHWSAEIVVGMFVAVVVASLVTVVVIRVDSRGAGELRIPTHPDTVSNSAPSATPLCIAAPIAGVAMRPCTY